MTKRIFVVILLLYPFTVYTNSFIDVYVCDLIINTDDNNSQSYNLSSIIKESLTGIGEKNFDFHSLSEILKEESVLNREKIKNDYMAFEVCDIIGIDYLIYGQIKKNSLTYKIELNLFSRKENKTILKVAKAKQNVDDLSRFIEEVLMETDSRVNNELSVDKEKNTINKKEKSQAKSEVEEKGIIKKNKYKIYLSNYIGIYNAVSYILPFPQYLDVYTGIIGFETGVSVVRLNLKKYKNITIFINPDLIFAYYLLTNKEQYSESKFHNFQFKTSFSAGLNINNFFDVTIGSGIGCQIDFLYQNYLDYSPIYVSPAFLLSCLLNCNFWLDKKRNIGLGVRNEFDFVFYKDFYVSYKPVIYTTIRFNEKKMEKYK